ncbi:MAG: virulence protein RhuM/Fic/DOC family protein [Kiritimatiellia bacterium]|jgi:prophage maintenance system killer protein
MTTERNKIDVKAAGGDIVLYRTKDGRAAVDVRLERDNIWLDAHQMARLFERDRSVIVRHIRNVFQTRELDPSSTCAKNAQVAADGKIRQMDLYNLDMIIAVGYRVNSRRGTEFRIWATSVLRDHLLKGYTLNEKQLQAQVARLSELQSAVDVMGRIIGKKAISGSEAEGLLRVIIDYSLALRLLDQYDHQQLSLHGITGVGRFVLTYAVAMPAIARMAETMRPLPEGIFGREKDRGLESAIGAVYQTFGGRDLYPSIEEKAAHLLYFVVKNHAFVDGNKRIGAFLFIWFLDANALLYRKDGTKRLADNALVALTLLIAESKPAEKDTICKVIVNLINRENL